MRTWACLVAAVPMLSACTVRRDPPAPLFSHQESDTESDTEIAEADSGEDRTVQVHSAEMDHAIESIRQGTTGDPVAEKNYLLPAVEILGFEFLLNQYDRRYVSRHDFGTDSGTIRDNLHSGWVIDKDPFSMNQFMHPYSGSIYHNFARSAGLDYWEALVYDFAGSAVWEVAGETLPPSRNDQITTTFAGSFLGEALFRTADLVLGPRGKDPGFGRQLAATAISPASAFNRWALGDRRGLDQRDPAAFWFIGIGGSRNTTLNDFGVLSDFNRNHATVAFDIDYGLPGKKGYTYDHPFDYFHLEGSAATSRQDTIQDVSVRGLLFGKDYKSGSNFDGVWGLYGTYDYFAPEIFRVSSTGVSLGTTGQLLLSKRVALQGTLLGGVGFTAAGTAADVSSDREYHYSASPQELVALRLILGDVAMFDLTANDYLMTGHTGSPGTKGTENIVRAQAAFVLRVYENHAIGIEYVQSNRDPRFSGERRRQSVGIVSIFYTLLGDPNFGVVRE